MPVSSPAFSGSKAAGRNMVRAIGSVSANVPVTSPNKTTQATQGRIREVFPGRKKSHDRLCDQPGQIL